MDCSIITNYTTIESNVTPTYHSSCSVMLIDPKPVCLLLTQYATIIDNNLVYYIYILNNLECCIKNIHLKDILPTGVEFISTLVENGEYKHSGNKIFYKINAIEPHSFCKITTVLNPTTLGEKTNSIEVMHKKLKCIANNPCKLSCMLGFKLDCI